MRSRLEEESDGAALSRLITLSGLPDEIRVYLPCGMREAVQWVWGSNGGSAPSRRKQEAALGESSSARLKGLGAFAQRSQLTSPTLTLKRFGSMTRFHIAQTPPVYYRAPNGLLPESISAHISQLLSSIDMKRQSRISSAPIESFDAGGLNAARKDEPRTFGFETLSTAPLVVDAVYRGGHASGYGADPLSKLINGCQNEGGFRAIGGRDFKKCRALVLSSSGTDINWPDSLDPETGVYTYFGDNKRPGCELHETPKGGNGLLRDIFNATSSPEGRALISPILVFSKTGRGRDVMFRGLAVPMNTASDGLVAIWRQIDGKRFQNYRARFEILNCSEVPRKWIEAIVSGDVVAAKALEPRAFRNWVLKGEADVLRAPRVIEIRSRKEQLPAESDVDGRIALDTIRQHFKGAPHDFEFVAAEIFRSIEPRVFDVQVTRMSADGGRDAVGQLRIGGDAQDSDGVCVEFSLEAKVYGERNGVGVKETSRLISRLRHRNFGVFVTTSFVGPQAYEEIRRDKHPIVIICAADVVRILRRLGLFDPVALTSWIDTVVTRGHRRA